LLDPDVQLELLGALPQLFPLFPSTITRRTIGALFPLPFKTTRGSTEASGSSSSSSSSASTSQATGVLLGSSNAQMHNLRSTALQSLSAALRQYQSKTVTAPGVLNELHSATLQIFQLLDGPLEFFQEEIRLSHKNCEWLRLLAESFRHLAPEIIEATLQVPVSQTATTSTAAARDFNFDATNAIAKAVFLRSTLVDLFVLSYTALNPCRTWCMSAPVALDEAEHSFSRSSEQACVAMMPVVVLPLKKAEARLQRKWIIDTLDTFWICSNLKVTSRCLRKKTFINLFYA
jgi:hypothetical protein